MSSCRLSLAAIAFVALRCGDQDIALFRANDAPSGGESCRSADDCPSSWSCAKADCTAETGVCEPAPVFCDAAPQPVCGCDGVSYWNDCIRRQNLVPASVSGECGAQALHCQAASDCVVTNAQCARLLPANRRCEEPQTGTCWILPTACDPTLDSMRWARCDSMRPGPDPAGGFAGSDPGVGPPAIEGPPAAGGPLTQARSSVPACMDTCNAIRAGGSFMPVREDQISRCN